MEQNRIYNSIGELYYPRMEWLTQNMSYCTTAPVAESSRQPVALSLGDKRWKLLASSLKADI